MSEFWHYVTLGFLWHGLLVAIEISVISFGLAMPLSVGLALMRLSRRRMVRALPAPFVWLMRGTPLLLQLVFWYDFLPQIGLHFNAFWTAIIALCLNEIAFSGEIIRGGIVSVKKTQREAATALGMSPWGVLYRVVLPQALRSIAPALANEAIVLLKNTSLASVIAVDELTLRSQQIVSANFRYVPVFLAAAILYLVATTVVAALQRYLEQRLDIEARGRLVNAPVGQRFPMLSRVGRRSALPAPDVPTVPTVPTPVVVPSVETADGGAASDGRRLVMEVTHADDAAVPPEHFVRIVDVHKSFHDRKILDGVSLDVRRGQVTFVLGPSGSGKTTLLRTINHLETIDGGEITVNGQLIGYRRTPSGVAPSRNVAKSRADARIGFVFQSFNLFDHMTVLDNIIEAPIRVYGRKPDDAVEDARALLTWAGLSGRENHYPHQLSGGQQQRIAIARALACRPRLMLFDEPTSALDPELVGEVLKLIRELAENGMTMIVVSHEIGFARGCADHVVFMDGGKVVEQGPPEQVLTNAQEERTRQFLSLIHQH